MKAFERRSALRCALAVTALALCSAAQAQTKDHAPVALQSSTKMTQDQAQSESWTYMKPELDLIKYRSVIVDPTAVYSGPDAQFDGIEATDRAKFAGMITEALSTELAKSFPASGQPSAQTLKIRVTLLGATKTTPGLATASRASSVGLALSALKSVRGKPGSLTGSLLIAVEVVDAATGEVLVAAVRRRFPDALDIPATLSTAATVKAIARDFAGDVRERLEAATTSP